MNKEPMVNVICDSINNKNRITTLELEYWSGIHSDICKLRCLNIYEPKKVNGRDLINRAKADPFIPCKTELNISGMSINPEMVNANLDTIWQSLALGLTQVADQITLLGIKDTVIKRILLPVSSVKILVTTTDIDELWRCKNNSEDPDFTLLIQTIQDKIVESTPVEKEKEHLPYIDDREIGARDKDMIALSCLRCMSFGKRDIPMKDAYDTFSHLDDNIKKELLCQIGLVDSNLDKWINPKTI